MGLSETDPITKEWLKFYHSEDHQQVVDEAIAFALNITKELKEGAAYSLGELVQEVAKKLKINPQFIRLEIYFALEKMYRMFLGRVKVGYEVFLTKKEE